MCVELAVRILTCFAQAAKLKGVPAPVLTEPEREEAVGSAARQTIQRLFKDRDRAVEESRRHQQYVFAESYTRCGRGGGIRLRLVHWPEAS
jgi:hypothetical protein